MTEPTATNISARIDGVFRTRTPGVAARGVPDQYADGKAARVWKKYVGQQKKRTQYYNCLLYTSPSPRDGLLSRMPSSA